jgi:hypothetical protein
MQHVLFPSLLAVKILQFYAARGEIILGEQALICYGTEGAASVRISPEVSKLAPALTRCIAAEPKEDTTYTLTAVGPGGEQSIKILRITGEAAFTSGTALMGKMDGDTITVETVKM